ncbi:MAG: phosphoribosylanthranilate isomerase [Erythrobacter sp.]|jgi:phosphoribosylanthranilate isomerase
MAGTRIKVCGISTLETLDAVLDARADYIGLNFYPPSPRHVIARQAAQLAERSLGRIARVGVFVDPDDALLAQAVAAGRLDAIQLHGAETPQRAAELRDRLALPVWKVLSVASAADIERASAYSGAADFILFDARTPGDAALPGGMGLRFDWTLLRAYRAPLPWGLAGGLTPDNVGEAIRLTGAPLVDTSSGVESAPGVKDVDKIAAFCKAARNA